MERDSLPEHASPARSRPDRVGQNWVHPGSHEEGVEHISLKLGTLCNSSRDNGARCGSKLQHRHELKMKDGTCSLTSHAKFNKMDLPARKPSTPSPAPADSLLHHRPSTSSANDRRMSLRGSEGSERSLPVPRPRDFFHCASEVSS